MTKEAIYNYFYKLGCADAIKYAAPKEEFVGSPPAGKSFGAPTMEREAPSAGVSPLKLDTAKAEGGVDRRETTRRQTKPKGLNSSQIGGVPYLKAKNTMDIGRVIPQKYTDAASAIYNSLGLFENQSIPSGFNRSAGAARAANPKFNLYNKDKQHSTKGFTFKGTWG